jgi:hypothetical protein
MTMAWEDSISETLDEAEEALKAAAKASDVSPTAAPPYPPTAPSTFFLLIQTSYYSFSSRRTAKSVGVSTPPIMLPAPTGEVASALSERRLGCCCFSNRGSDS